MTSPDISEPAGGVSMKSGRLVWGLGEGRLAVGGAFVRASGMLESAIGNDPTEIRRGFRSATGLPIEDEGEQEGEGMSTKRCPCGCGRKVGLTKRGAASALQRVDELRAIATPMVSAMARSAAVSAEERAENQKLLTNMDAMRGWLIEHIHGSARPGATPNLLDLHNAINLLEGDVAYIVTVAGATALDEASASSPPEVPRDEAEDVAVSCAECGYRHWLRRIVLTQGILRDCRGCGAEIRLTVDDVWAMNASHVALEKARRTVAARRATEN